MNRHFTDYAQTHVMTLRARRHAPTWDDVAAAYDLGLLHATSRTGQQRRHLRVILEAVRALNAPEPEAL